MATWSELRRRFGLDPTDIGGVGTRSGTRVEVEVAGGDPRWFWWPFEPPLDLGLRMFESLLPLVPGRAPRRVLTGDRAFDRSVRGIADEADRAALLFSADVREGWAAVRHLGIPRVTSPKLVLRDDGLRCELWMRGKKLDAAFERLLELRQCLEASRASLPPAAPMTAQRPAWERFARLSKVPYDTAPLRIRAPVGPGVVHASTRRVGPDRHEFQVRLDIERPFELGLLIASRSLATRIGTFVLGAAPAFEDAQLDARYELHAREAAEAKQRIDGEVVRLLLNLLERATSVEVHDDHASASGPCRAGDVEGVPAVAQALASVVSRMQFAPADGAFR